MVMSRTFVTMCVVLSCSYMETKSQDEDTYINAVLNTSFLNFEVPVRIFNGANRNLLVITRNEVYSVMTKEQDQTLTITNSQLVRKVKSLYDAVLLSSTQILFSDSTTCMKLLNLENGAIKTYVGSCNEILSRNGPRLEARLQTPRCLARTDKAVYITDEQSREIKMMTVWDATSGEPDGFISQVFTAFVDTDNMIVAPSYMTTCGEGHLYVTVLNGVIRVRIYQHDAHLFTGSSTPALADTDPTLFYQQRSTTVSFNVPQGIIQLRSGLLAVADSLNNRLRFVFPARSVTGVLTNITLSICGEGDVPKNGDLRRCVLYRPHSLNPLGYRILIGEPNGIRIVSDYRTIYTNLAVTFRNVYGAKGFGKLNLTPAEARVLQSSTWQDMSQDYGVIFSIDRNFTTFSYTKPIPNQWWKVYLQKSSVILDRIIIYKRRDDCQVEGQSGSVDCFLLLLDLNVLISTTEGPWDKIPALNDPDWTLCHYRNEQFSTIEEIRCDQTEPAARHIAFYVQQNTGIALREIEIFKRIPGVPVNISDYTTCVLPSTQPTVTVPFWEGEFATTGLFSITSPIHEKTTAIEETTIPIEEATIPIESKNLAISNGPAILNVYTISAIGGCGLLAIIITTGLAVYFFRRGSQRPDSSPIPTEIPGRNTTKNSSYLATAISHQRSGRARSDVNSRHADNLVVSARNRSSAQIPKNTFNSDFSETYNNDHLNGNNVNKDEYQRRANESRKFKENKKHKKHRKRKKHMQDLATDISPEQNDINIDEDEDQRRENELQ